MERFITFNIFNNAIIIYKHSDCFTLITANITIAAYDAAAQVQHPRTC
jgi:hypothetical protein